MDWFYNARNIIFRKQKVVAKPNARKIDLDEQLRIALNVLEVNPESSVAVGAVADLYGKLSLPFRAIDVIRSIREGERPTHLWLRLALSYASVGDIEGRNTCLEALDTFYPDLPEGQTVKYHLLKCQMYAETGNYRGVLDDLRFVGEVLPDELETQRLEALYALGEREQSSAGYRRLFDKIGIKTGIAKSAINHFHRVNDHVAALDLTRKAMAREPKDASLKAVLCRTYWSMGDMQSFAASVRKAFSESAVVSQPMLSHGQKAIKVDPTIAEDVNRLMTTIERRVAKNTSFSSLKLGVMAVQVGRFDIARGIAERYLNGGGVSPQGLYLSALCDLSDGENSAGRDKLISVLNDCPQLDAAYHHLYSAAAASESTVTVIKDTIESRRKHVSRFRIVDSAGRLVHQNPDLIALHYINNDFEEGLREKVHRRALSALTQYSPKNRPPRKEVHIQNGGSILLIADDGVSDEVRWVQHLDSFAKRFDRVEMTCEPRLLTIMKRSFPRVQFHPVNRIWGESPKRFTDLRTEIPDWEIAHYLDAQLFRRLRSFDHVAFLNEMVFQLVKESGTLLPARGLAPYLIPDPQIRHQWASKISAMSGRNKRVGVLWRSSVIDRKRGRFYFELEALREIIDIENCTLFSLQHAAKPEEIDWCKRNGIHVLDLDLFEDFEGIAAISAELDVVVGPSTLPTELAAAVGTPVLIPGINFETVGIRLGKGMGAACRHTKNAYVVCDPYGYDDPDADQAERLERVMGVAAEEIRTSRYGKGLTGY